MRMFLICNLPIPTFILTQETPQNISMNTPNFNARLAGFLYLTLVIFGILNLAYIPSQLIVWDNPAETLSNIQQSEGLFRLGHSQWHPFFPGLFVFTLGFIQAAGPP